MITGAAEPYVEVFVNHFTETNTHFIGHLEDIDIYFKKANNLSFLESHVQLVTNNKNMTGKSIWIVQLYNSWAYIRQLPKSFL